MSLAVGRGTAASSSLRVSPQGPAQSTVFDEAIRRGAAGLFAAGTAQVLLSLPLTSASYAWWWPWLVGPAVLAAAAVAAVLAWRSRRSGTDRWLVALCGLTASASLTASLALVDPHLRAANAVVPLAQLGAFACGLAPGWRTWTAALAMLAAHRTGIVLWGVGTPAEHLTSAAWEVGSLLAAAVGTLGCRLVARRADEADAELALSTAQVGRAEARRSAARHVAMLLHDQVLSHLHAVGLGADASAFRADLRRSVAILERRDRRDPTPSHDETAARLRAAAAAGRSLGLRVDLRVSGSGPEAPDAVAQRLGLVAEEALRNVARHSGAGVATVTLRGVGDRWTLTVSDAGRGFDPAVSGSGRLGIAASIALRMADVGGTGTVESTPGVGTVVRADWPAPPPPPPRASRARARARWAGLGAVMWPSILVGLSIMGVVNLAVLLAHRDDYRDLPVVLALWAVTSLVTAEVWRRSRKGLGPGGSVAAVLTAAGSYAVLTAELAGTDQVGPANWAGGYGALVLVLLPFSRPVGEVVTAAALVLAGQVATAARSFSDPAMLHLAALNTLSAPFITVGATLLVVQLRRITDLGERQRAEVALRARIAAVDDAIARELERRGRREEDAALTFLREVGDGTRAPGPGTRAAAVGHERRLRAEITLRLRPSYLQSALFDVVVDGEEADRPVTVRDDANLGHDLDPADLRRVVGLVRRLATADAVLVVLAPGTDPADQDGAELILRVDGPPPGVSDEPLWRALADRAGAVELSGAGRSFLQTRLTLRPDLRRTR